VAIKLPRPDHINERSRLALAREAEAILPLAHPPIQRLLATRLEDPVPYLVFALILDLDNLCLDPGRTARSNSCVTILSGAAGPRWNQNKPRGNARPLSMALTSAVITEASRPL
jgi:hypothetical protein